MAFPKKLDSFRTLGSPTLQQALSSNDCTSINNAFYLQQCDPESEPTEPRLGCTIDDCASDGVTRIFWCGPSGGSYVWYGTTGSCSTSSLSFWIC